MPPAIRSSPARRRDLSRAASVAVLLLAAAPDVLQAQAPSFSDQTAAAGLVHTHTPPAGFATIPMLAGAGAADLDGNGHADLLVMGGGGAPDALFLSDGAGLFTNVAGSWNADAVHVGAGVALGDVDDDGWIDAFVSSHGPADAQGPGHHRLYLNQAGAGFSEQAAARGVATSSPTEADGFGACFGDADLDGDLDLVVAGWITDSGGNRLFANDGTGQFTDVTTTAITADLTGVHGFTPILADMDDDLWPELLLAADFGTSRYLVNVGGTFHDQTASSGTGLDSNGMGAVVADFDGDGRLDWSVTSIIDPATGTGGSGNMLYLNQGDHVFTEVAVAAGVNAGFWGWGTLALDVEHDGDLDLLEVNGWQGPPWSGQPARLFVSDGAGNFSEGSAAAGLVHTGNGRGLLHLDGDGDGDQDLVLLSLAEPLAYFRNDLTGPDTHALRVVLDAGGAPEVAPGALGARLTATVADLTRTRLLTGAGSFLSCSEPVLTLGLGAAAVADEVQVTWPDGTRRELLDVPADVPLFLSCCAGWKTIGSGLPGVDGVPGLAGAGTLLAGDPVELSISGARPDSSAFVVIGFGALDAPFKGGVLIPTPDFVLPPLPTAAGTVSLGSSWPTGLPGAVAVWFQAWLPDPVAPAGYAATAGLRATTP